MSRAAGRLRLLLDLLTQAGLAMRENRLRSLLSMLGIAVGVAAVIAVSAASRAGQAFVLAELETFGLRSVWVFRDYQDKDPHRRVRPGSGIDNADLHSVQAGCCGAVRRVSPVVEDFEGRVIQAGNRYSNAELKGVDEAFIPINNDILSQGRNLRRRDVTGRRAVAVIGPTVRDDLFGNEQSPIGRGIRIGGRKFIVVGLLKAKSRDLLASIGSAGGEDANNRILIPYTVYQQMLGKEKLSYLQAEALSLDAAESAADQLMSILRRHHGDHYAYKKITMASYVENVRKILLGVTTVGVVAASVSLLVGGIGIVSVMSTAVLERTREIGLRKAVGARRRDILVQFLLEAVSISLAGGLAGLAFGLTVVGLLDVVTGFALSPAPITVVLGVLVSTGVGLLAGLFPARRAASLPPVEALRYE